MTEQRAQVHASCIPDIYFSLLPNARKTVTIGNYIVTQIIKCSERSFFLFFSVRLLSVLCGHSGFSSPPQRPMTSDFVGFSIPDVIHYIYLNSWERASIFPFQCWGLNKGTTGTVFITSLVWRGPWLGIEPGTSRTRCQHYTTRYRGGGWWKMSVRVFTLPSDKQNS